MFTFDTLFDLGNSGSVNEIFDKMASIFTSCWLFISNYLFYLIRIIRFITRYFFRFRDEEDSKKNDLNSAVLLQDEDRIGFAENDSICFESKPEVITDSEYDGDAEKESPKFNFKFQFRTDGDSRSNQEERTSTSNSNSTSILHKYNFSSEKGVIGFMEEPKIMSFCVQESYFDLNYGHKEISHGEFTDGFLLENDFSQFTSEKDDLSEEEFKNSSEKELENSGKLTDGFLSENDLLQITPQKKNLHEEEPEKSCAEAVSIGEDKLNSDVNSLELSEGLAVENCIDDSRSDGFLSERGFGGIEQDCNDERVESLDEAIQKENLHEELENFGAEAVSISEDRLNLDVNFPELNNLSDGLPVTNHIPDSSSDGFLSERDFGEIEQECNEERTESIEEAIRKTEETLLQNSWIWDTEEFTKLSNDLASFMNQIKNSKLEETSDTESVSFSDESFSVQTPINDSKLYGESLSEKDFSPQNGESDDSEETHFHKSTISDTESIDSNDGSCSVEKDFREEQRDYQNSEVTNLVNHPIVSEKESIGVTDGFSSHQNQNSEKTHLANSSNLDTEESTGLESLWEHQDLIEQLRIELRKVKATGLPTILEESECPKMVDDLKPWKIDEKLVHEDRMDELNRFYKSYRERMRKFDILNYQKMYAMGFLQLKDPLQSMASQKTSYPTFTSFISQNLWPLKRRKPSTDPSKKFIKELQSDLEVVYVGQACLSWEFLHWQYHKVRELPESDPYGIRRYNQVAEEFQQFQVLMQRFVENEPFQGPRVQNYVKSRCVLRNLLQVPPIKEDCLKDKREDRKRKKDTITSDMLIQIIEESIRVFWEFIRADKDEGNVIMKSILGNQVELQDPTDSDLLADVEIDLQKKEKKLKDLLRSGNCVVKIFQKNQEDRLDQVLFFSRIDIKLVSRVLTMSKLTSDQLAWCHKKLDNITVTHRKLYREPSFLLFPC